MIEIQLSTGGRVRALLFGLLSAGAILPHATAVAGTRDFNGQLDYDAFKRAAARNETVRISYSPGGTGAAALALARAKVIIDGQCNSACAWSFVKNENACFTSRAVFGFHAAHDPGSGRRMNAATSYWLSTVRPSLRGRLTPLLETSSLINVPASQMRAYYGDRVCGAKPAAETVAASAVETKSLAPSSRETSRKAATITAKSDATEVRSQKVRERKSPKRGAETPWPQSSSFDGLVGALQILEAPIAETEHVLTFATFVRRSGPTFAIEDGVAAELVQERAISAERLAPEQFSLESVAEPVAGFIETSLPKDDEKGTPSDERLIMAGRDERTFEGRTVVGIEGLGPEASADGMRLELPIATAAHESLALLESTATPTILSKLKDPGTAFEECASGSDPSLTSETKRAG